MWTTEKKSRPLHAMLLVLAAVALFVVIDTLSKYLTRFYPVTTVIWARYFFHTVFVVLALGPRLGLGLVRTARPQAQLIRGVLLAVSSVFFVNAVKVLPLAECTAIAFLAPLLVTIMAVFFLKEKVEAARWVAIVGGFLGVLIIIRPGSGVFSWASLLPMGTALSFAAYQILTRRLAGLESPFTSIFYAGLVGTVVLSAAVAFTWTAPQSAFHWFLLVLLGTIGGLSHLILIKAYDYAPASRLAPFSYTQLIWVTLAGYLVFDNFPDLWSLVGIATVMASGIYIARHQHLSERAQVTELRVGPPGS